MSRTITGQSSVGVVLTEGSDDPVTVASGAGIATPGAYAIEGTAPIAWTITNFGTLSGGEHGVTLASGGSVTNAAGGEITATGTGAGVAITGGPGTVVNAGTIGSAGTYAVTLPAGYGNLLQVAPGALFVGKIDGGGSASLLELASAASQGTLGGLGSQFVDFGQVIVDPGASWAVSGSNTLAAGVTLTDQGALLVDGGAAVLRVNSALNVGGGGGAATVSGGGWISAYHLGIGVQGPGAVTIIGPASHLLVGNGAMTIGAGAAGLLSVLDGGLVQTTNFDITGTGSVDLAGAGSQAVVADDLHVASQGVLTMGNDTTIGVHYQLLLDPGARVQQSGAVLTTPLMTNSGSIGGFGTLAATEPASNNGTLFAQGGNELISAPTLGGNGVLAVQSGGSLALNIGTLAATQTVTFTDGTGTLTIDQFHGFPATIDTFLTGDQIILQGISIAADSFDTSSHVLTLFDGNNATIGTLQFGPTVSGADLPANAAGGVGVVPCFAAGTRISTMRGEVAVEHLQPGDRVQVQDGDCLPVVWLGRRTIDCTRHPAPHKVWPVRVAAHALGRNLPARDLYLSPDHALLIDDVLIPVRHLLNGRNIRQIRRDSVAYYHVELPHHSIVLAEGLPAESFLDTGGRGNFANGGAVAALHPDFAARRWEAEACAPLVVTGEKLLAARRWIDALARLGVRTDRGGTARDRIPVPVRRESPRLPAR